MLTVIDVGCATYGGDNSIDYLLEEFKPDKLIGYDPNVFPESGEPIRFEAPGRADLVLNNAAAWLHNGTVRFVGSGLSGYVTDKLVGREVPCIDLCELVANLEGEIILKMDAEGSEYHLLPALIEDGLDEKIKLLWVEWHCLECGRGAGLHHEHCSQPVNDKRDDILQRWRGEVAEWNR